MERKQISMSIRKEKIDFFERTLADFFRKAGREHLPWRKQGITAYEVWVSEIMLQQTQVSRVIGYYTKFLQRFPRITVLARVTWEEFLPYYEGLGYYNRGRNMLKAARMVVSQHGGKFPRERKALEKIPGIGPYTAAAIMSFAYGDEHLAWDTNLKRVIGRFFFGSKRGVTDEIFWEDKFETPKKNLNAALMDFGSSRCTGRPKCNACPLAKHCRYYKERGQGEEVVSRSTERTVDWEKARTYIVLHAGHRQYFSENTQYYEPLRLPRKHAVSRSALKAWFQERYGLVVAVRPPKKDVERGVILINVQILSGQFPFVVYSRQAWQSFLETHSVVVN